MFISGFIESVSTVFNSGGTRSNGRDFGERVLSGPRVCADHPYIHSFNPFSVMRLDPVNRANVLVKLMSPGGSRKHRVGSSYW